MSGRPIRRLIWLNIEIWIHSKGICVSFSSQGESGLFCLQLDRYITCVRPVRTSEVERAFYTCLLTWYQHIFLHCEFLGVVLQVGIAPRAVLSSLCNVFPNLWPWLTTTRMKQRMEGGSIKFHRHQVNYYSPNTWRTWHWSAHHAVLEWDVGEISTRSSPKVIVLGAWIMCQLE